MIVISKIQLTNNYFQLKKNTIIVAIWNDFTDVTLACEDGHQVEALKVILAASSPLFHSMLRINKHAHPLIYMRGLK